MMAKIEITSKELIKPLSATPHDRKQHQLSFLDQFQSPIYVPVIFFYQNQNESSSNVFDHSTRSHHLKQSLSYSLTKFHQLAGRIKGNVAIDCNDSGALFVEARVLAPLSEAVRNAPVAGLNQYLPLKPYAIPDGETNNTDDVPLLALQVSSFECGGTAIGVCISHKIADITSLVTFVNYWAALSRGEKIDEDPLAQPICDLTSQLFPGVPEDSPLPNYLNVGGKEKLECKRFLFDKLKLAELKKLASSDEFLGVQVKNPTRVEAVSAFILKQIMDISRAKGDRKSIFVASHTVNLRSRMKKSLPPEQNDNVFGNFFILTSGSLTSWAMGNHYQELVWILRTAIRRVNDDLIRMVQSGVPYLNAFFKGGGLVHGLSDSQEMTSVCYFTSWCRFPIYEVDFGWGKPVTVCTSATQIKNGVILMSTKLDDGLEAWITMSEDEMAMLPDEFLSLETTSYY